MAAMVVAANARICQQYDFPFVHRVSDHHAPQQAWAIFLGLDAGEPNHGVVFVQVWHGAGQPWDSPSSMSFSFSFSQ